MSDKNIKLCLEHGGMTWTIETHIEEYNLDKPLARAEIADCIQRRVKQIKDVSPIFNQDENDG